MERSRRAGVGVVALLLGGGVASACVGAGGDPIGAAAAPIVEGELASNLVFPNVGAFVVTASVTVDGDRYDRAALGCSGTLVAPDVVLTAAHCLEEPFEDDVDAVEWRFSLAPDLDDVGYERLTAPDDAVGLAGSVVHPGWDPDGPVPNGVADDFFDLAVVFLEAPVEDVEPAALCRGDAELVREGQTVTVVGYGDRHPFVTHRYGPNSIRSYGRTSIGAVGEREILVGTADTPRRCFGDSGGPTFLLADDGLAPASRVVGVGSHSTESTTTCYEAAVDTRVDAYLGWIDEAVEAACVDGPRTACADGGELPAPRPVDDAPVTGSGCAVTVGASEAPVRAGWLLLWLVWCMGRRRRALGRVVAAALLLGACAADVEPDEAEQEYEPTVGVLLSCEMWVEGACPAQMACDLVDSAFLSTAETFCRPVWRPGTDGDVCHRMEECGQGLVCIVQFPDAEDIGQCRRHCRVDDDCPVAGSLCAGSLIARDTGERIEGIDICTPVCDPFTAAGCPAGWSCTVAPTLDTGAIQTDCRPTGAGVQRDPCETHEDCAGGHICSDITFTDASGAVTSRAQFCTALCDLGGATGCEAIPDAQCIPPGIRLNVHGVDYGICIDATRS